MIEALKNLMVHSGATWVLWLMIGLSVISFGIALDRARYFFSRRDDIDAVTRHVRAALSSGDIAKTKAILAQSRSVEASVGAAGLALWHKGPEAIKEAMAAASGRERALLEARLGFLGTVGNNAPFVGLLGTVIGIVGGFDAMGKGGAGSGLGAEIVMGNISEALVATAVGLVVAIPVVAVFNYFTGKITQTIEGAETLGHLILAYAEGATPSYALLRPHQEDKSESGITIASEGV
jgi:biopolymer transport protein ExbB/TolQ